MGHDGCDGDGHVVGLANVAAFLSHAMIASILDDSCDEINWEPIMPTGGGAMEFEDEEGGALDFEGVYPLSNACGQRGVSYAHSVFHANSCPEEHRCDADPGMIVTAASSSPSPPPPSPSSPPSYASDGDRRPPHRPPPLTCRPRTADEKITGYFDPRTGNVTNGWMTSGDVVPSSSGKTDVEGCCWWGRGALHTRGVCGLGRVNAFLGAGGGGGGGGDGGGSENLYPDVDFCKDPEKVCTDATRTMGMRWTVALFEWIDRVQSYDDVDTVDVDDYDDGGDGDGVVLGRRRWNYIDRLHSFAHTNDVIESVRSSFLVGTPPHFIDMVGGILEQGCPYPPCVEDDDDGSRPNRLRFRSERKRAFVDALGGVGLPIRGEAYRAMEAHFKGGEDGAIRRNFEEVLLRSSSSSMSSSSSSSSATAANSSSTRPSMRYSFEDFMEGLRKMSDVGYVDDEDDGDDVTPERRQYFYIGRQRRRRRGGGRDGGHRGAEEEAGGAGGGDGTSDRVVAGGDEGGPDESGLLNVAIFLSYAIEMSIHDDACDEHNTQRINGRQV